jgi:dipeptidyl aminopeptidase/acylaminoacyl peptidase
MPTSPAGGITLISSLQSHRIRILYMPGARTRRAKRSKFQRRRLITAEDLLQFIWVSDPQLSPEGDSIVFVRKHVGEKNEYVTNLWSIDVHDRKPTPRQFTSGGKDAHPRFSPDGTRIAFISGRNKPKPQIFIMSAAGGEATALTKFPEGAIASFKWSPDGRMLAVSFREQDPEWTDEARKKREEKGLTDPPRVLDDWWYRLDGDGYFNAQRHHLYIIDSATGEHRELYAKDTLGHFSFDFSPDSSSLVVASNRDRKAMTKPWKDELLIIDVATGRIRPIPNMPDGPKLDVQWSPDGRTIAYAGRVGKDAAYSVENLELFICDPKRGNARSLTARTDYCLMAVAIADTTEAVFGPKLRFSPDGRRIYFKLGWHGQSHIASVATRGGKITALTRGDVDHDFGSISPNGKLIAITAGTATRIAEVHIGDIGAGRIRARAVTDFNTPLLRQLELSEPQSHWIKSADGNDVQVWTLLPPRAKRGKKVPAVLEIHGGPHAMYGVGFFHEFQLLAANGYAVFFPNPRGSKGYGRDHCAAIRGSWGGADWVDVQAIMKFMKSRSFVNRKRMGIMGGSYGGYMTNWAIGHTDEFAGAITDRCVSNVVSMFGSSDYTDAPDMYWPGNSWDRPEAMWECSPLKYLGNASTPTLIIHSEGDLRCNIEQAEQVFTALKLNDVPVRFVRYPRSTFHGMSRNGPTDLRLHRLHQILDWWGKYLRR